MSVDFNPPRFILSFAILSELINDEKTRTFLTMEVSAGHHEVNIWLLQEAYIPIVLSATFPGGCSRSSSAGNPSGRILRQP